MRIENVIFKIGGLAALLMALDFAISGFVHPWFAISWGVIVAICLFRTESISQQHGSKINITPPLQFVLVLLLLVVTVITTRWAALGWQNLRQWGLVIFTVAPLYWRGLVWARSYLKGTR